MGDEGCVGKGLMASVAICCRLCYGHEKKILVQHNPIWRDAVGRQKLSEIQLWNCGIRCRAMGNRHNLYIIIIAAAFRDVYQNGRLAN